MNEGAANEAAVNAAEKIQVVWWAYKGNKFSAMLGFASRRAVQGLSLLNGTAI